MSSIKKNDENFTLYMIKPKSAEKKRVPLANITNDKKNFEQNYRNFKKYNQYRGCGGGGMFAV